MGDGFLECGKLRRRAGFPEWRAGWSRPGRSRRAAVQDNLRDGARSGQQLGFHDVDEAHRHAYDQGGPDAFLQRVPGDAGQGKGSVPDEDDGSVQDRARFFRGADGARPACGFGLFRNVGIGNMAVDVLRA